MNKYFIIGTDTDCGKTYATCQLISHLKYHKHNVIGLKPVASGCFLEDDILISDDARCLQQYNGFKSNDMTISPWRFREPISPHLAAEMENKVVSAEEIITFCNSDFLNNYDYVLIEGAGGLCVPLNYDETWVDVLVKSGIPVIMVVGMRLGCINHALLTYNVLKSYKIECVGWIANEIDPHMLALELNIKTLSYKLDCKFLGRISYEGGFVENIIL